MSDLFGVAGTALLDRLDLPAPYAARIASLRRMVREPGYTALQNIPGIGPTLAAVFVAEIGDITRFASAPKLTCWAGLTPKHHEWHTHVHRGAITKQGSRLVRWAAIESVKAITAGSPAGVLRERVADRGDVAGPGSSNAASTGACCPCEPSALENRACTPLTAENEGLTIDPSTSFIYIVDAVYLWAAWQMKGARKMNHRDALKVKGRDALNRKASTVGTLTSAPSARADRSGWRGMS